MVPVEPLELETAEPLEPEMSETDKLEDEEVLGSVVAIVFSWLNRSV